ncbi:MAG: amino acid adenylation domain-containing protein, partial [Lachnospiraceae bacterium]|nr:amino acid adenylation domain-containing protein [Lachnospiraceae bacterium]
YGPTECSIYTTTSEVHGEADGRIIGRPIANMDVFVADPYGRLVPGGAAGELFISGAGVGAGYLNRPALTREKFVSIRTEGHAAPVMAYRTGDLVRWDEGDKLEFLGRLDNQVKLRGLRIELGEIESCAAKYEGITGAAAVIRKDAVVLYYTTGTGPLQGGEEALRDFLKRTLPDYMVPEFYVHLETMPLNANGKTDRNALPDPVLGEGEDLVAPESFLEKEIFRLVSQQLHTANLGVTTNLIQMGLSSLGAMSLSVLLHKALGRTLKMSDILKNPTVRGMAEKLSGEDREDFLVKPFEKREYYPITENQRGIYLDWEMHRDTRQYNIPEVHVMKGMQLARLRDVIETVVNAHSYLKTRLELHDGDVMQKRQDDAPVRIKTKQLDQEPSREFFQEKVRPFHLLEEPLYRIELYAYQDTVYFFMDMHHIIFDGLSGKTFLQDIKQALDGQAPEKETVTAYDFALYEKEQEGSREYEEAHAYFSQLFMDANIMSYPESVHPDGEGQGIVRTDVDADVVERARKKYEVTAGAYLQAAFAETMSRFMWEENPMYLTISNGRTGLPQLNRSFGMFVKTVPTVYKSARTTENDSVRDYVRSFQEQLLDTYLRELYPYTRLVEESHLRGEILFVYQGGIREGGEIEGVEIIDLALDTEKFPLQVTVYPYRDQYEIRLDYDGSRYAKTDIELLAGAIRQVIISMADAERFQDIRLVSFDEEKELFIRSKGRDMEVDTTITWLSLLRKATEKYPDRIAVVDERRNVTYRELDLESNAVAAYLVDQGVTSGEFVAMRMDRWAENIVAIVGIHKAGGAYAPVDLNYPKERQQYMLENCEAKVVLTEEVMKKAVETYSGAEPVDRAVPEGNAYIIYTSGSTGLPKGTILHHAGIVNFAIATAEMNELTCEDRICLHSSFSFDAHTEDLFPPLIAGASIHIMPESVRKDPDLIYRYLVDHQITGGAFTTSLGRLLAMNYKLPQRFIALMGEALTEITPGETTVINKYGFTECTNITTYYFLEKGQNYDRAPIGYTMPNGYSLILDPKGALVPFGGIGEICYAGPQVGYGYWKLEERTARVFTDCRWIPGMRLYHSGDLGRYNEDGVLEYIGRMDHQVKVHGYRVEFGEIESAALRFEGVYEAVAAVKQGRVVLYYTEKTQADGSVTAPVDEDSLRAFMARGLAEFLMPEVFVRLDDMPRTPSRKIDRRALPEPAAETGGEMIPPETELEKKLFAIVAEQLGTEEFGVTTSLISMGLSSLGVMRLSMTLNVELGRSPLVSDIMKDPTIRGMAAHLGTADEKAVNKEDSAESGAGIHAYGKRDYYPITENQRGLFIDWELHRDTLQYNVPEVTIFKGADIDEVEKAVRTVMDAHAYLKTRLFFVDGDVMQKRLDDEQVIIRKEKLDREPGKEDFQALVRPFDLLQEPLYRIELMAYQDTVYLFMDMHHIIFDGLTKAVVLQEIQEALAGKEIRKEEITAFDFALSEEEWMESAVYSEAEEHFDSLLAGAVPAALAESDAPDGSGVSVAEASLSREAVDAFCRSHDVTVSSFFHAAFAETLYRLTREEHLAYVTVSNGRGADARLERTAGMFVKTIPVVRNEDNLKGADSSVDYVKAIHAQLQKSFSYERYPYTRMAERNGIHAGILLSYQGEIFDEEVMEGSLSGHIGLALDTAKFAIEGFVCPVKDTYVIHLSYDGKLYGGRDMQLLADAFANAAKELTVCSRRTEVSLADEREREALILAGTGEKLFVDPKETIVSMFRKRAAATPDATALAFREQRYTYGEIDDLTDRMAAALVAQYHVGPGDIVGVLIRRSAYMLIYPLAVMKAGAAYMPMNPDFPEDRLSFMCSDAGVKLILTADGAAGQSMPGHTGVVVDLADERGERAFATGEVRLPEAGAADRMVILYTSGSTGEPKAAVLCHSGIVNFMHWYVKEYEVTEKDRAGAYSNFGFDAHMIDIYSSVLAGACAVIIPEELRRNLTELNAYYEENGITISFMTTQVGCLFSEMNKTLRVLTTGG